MKEWHIYVDGASLGNPGFAGAGMIAFDEDGHEMWRDSIHLGLMTNNMAEYEALVRALRKVGDPAGRPINVYTDSQLVAYQILGKYRIKNEGLKPYLKEALRLMRTLPHVAIKYIPREGNKLADKLAKDAAAKRGRRMVAGHDPEESPGIEGQDGL